MDFARGLRFPFQDPEWLKKIAIGALISLVPIFQFTMLGYMADTLRNVYHGRETPLPDYNDIGGLFVRGLMVVLIQLLWILPLLVLLCPAFALVGIAGAASDEPGALFALMNVCVWGLYIVAALLITPLLQAAIARYAVSNNFNDALPGPVIAEVRGNPRPWIMVVLFSLALAVIVAIVAVPVVLLTLGFGGLLLLPVQVYIQLATAHWLAQAHRASTGSYTATSSMV